MGRFSYEDADNYGNSGNRGSFFSLKNDGDIGRVRFMYNDMNDVVGYAVHEVEVDGKKRYVNCIRDYNSPKSDCPFCAANNVQKAKMFIPLYNLDADEVQIWERGKNFFAKMASVCSRYASANSPLVSHTFEIERHGKKGDTQTTYELFEVGNDDTRMSDLPELPEILGGYVLDKTADDMDFFISEGYFPNNDGAPSRRTEPDRKEEMPSGRRTPSRRGESF